MLITLINLALSPFCLLFFVFAASGNSNRYFTPSGTNISKLKPIPYFIYLIIYLSIVLGLAHLWNLYSNNGISIWEMFIPKYYWVSISAWVVTGYTLFTYLKGMEGNIMGFIFFPLLLLASSALIGANFRSLFLSPWDLNLPILNYNFWILFIMHAFSPIYILAILKKDDSEEPYKNNWVSSIATSIIFQLMLYGVNWLVIKLFGGTLTFRLFFGEKQNVVYYLPMAIGFLYFIFLFISKNVSPKNKPILSPFTKGVTLLIFVFSVLQIVNYVRLIVGTLNV